MRRLLPALVIIFILIVAGRDRTPEPVETRLIIPPAVLPETVHRGGDLVLLPTLSDTVLQPDNLMNIHAPYRAVPNIGPRADFGMRCNTDVTVCADIPSYNLNGMQTQTLFVPDTLTVLPIALIPPLPNVYGEGKDQPIHSMGVMPRQTRTRWQQAIPYSQ